MILKLEGEAFEWWEALDPIITKVARHAMTWGIFNRKVHEYFYTPGKIRRIEREFVALEKGNICRLQSTTLCFLRS